jgi:hypothetical protein
MKREEEKKAKGKRQKAKGGEQSSKFKARLNDAVGQVQSSKFSEQSAESKGRGAKSREQGAGSEHPFLPLNEGEYGFSREGVNKEQPAASSQLPRPTGSSGRAAASKISTVYNIKKPSSNGIYIPAEGCISGSRAIKACLMIRVFNN